MRELELLIARSPFRWWQYNDRTRVAAAFDVWAIVFNMSGLWHSFGGQDGQCCHLSATANENEAVSAGEDWIRAHGNRSSSGKRSAWLAKKITAGQWRIIDQWGDTDYPTLHDRYEASCAITMRFNRRKIRKALTEWATIKVAA